MDLENDKGALVVGTMQLEYEWGENPVIDKCSRLYGYSPRESIVYIGVEDGVTRAVSFIAAMPNGLIRLFRDSGQQVIGKSGIEELKRVLETDYLAVADMGEGWSISSDKPISAAERLAESILADDDRYSDE